MLSRNSFAKKTFRQKYVKNYLKSFSLVLTEIIYTKIFASCFVNFFWNFFFANTFRNVFRPKLTSILMSHFFKSSIGHFSKSSWTKTELFFGFPWNSVVDICYDLFFLDQGFRRGQSRKSEDFDQNTKSGLKSRPITLS
jgi:hypothetical protein